MSTTTDKLGLIKPAENEFPDIAEAVNNNMDLLDQEVWKRGKTFNGAEVGSDGGFHVNSIPYAENLETSYSQKSDASYIIRTTGGDASIADHGDAWLILMRGTRTHTAYVPQEITMTVIPMERTPDPAITATLNEETFEEYVGEAGTYQIVYTENWSEDPSNYGLTISNTPLYGDSISITWDGENDAVVTVNAVTRPTPPGITATIDEAVFVAYVLQSGTTTLTYSTGWSADPTLYGITVTGTPIAGDVIQVVYVKEVRGTITQSNPQTFVSTGWNLYNNNVGYARLIKYSSESGYGFKISGAYTALEFATTIGGTRTTITPVSGYFTIPNDGYLFVTGGNATTTQVWMTWSDWTTTANGGEFEPYEQHVIDFSTFMAENFPYGLMSVNDIVQDEINLNIGVATSNVVRQAYNATNLANAKASGRQYEYDEDYIYIERAEPVTFTITVDGDFEANDHGMEYYTGTDQAVYTQTIYGMNLKNKLERDVLTISQQSLTSAQQTQVRTNIGAGSAAAVATNATNIASNTQAIANINSALRPTNAAWITNANLNDYTTTGQYMIGNNPTNSPTPWAILTVIANRPDTTLQLVEENRKVYIRECRNNVWRSWQELAHIETEKTTLTSDGLSCTYNKRGGFCYVRINGLPTTTSNITFTVPMAVEGAYVTTPQWGNNSTIMQAFIDASTTTLIVRNHSLDNVNVSFVYPI